MKKRILFFALTLFAISGSLAAQGLTFSGILDSSVSLRAGAGDAPAFMFGVEEYANLRMQAKIRDKAMFYGALNLIAAAGDSAQAIAQMEALTKARGYAPFGISPSSFAGGENFIAGIELERLYLRLYGEYLDFDGGLLRLPFGYGQVWGPSDFLNPRNPLIPDARPRAVLGAGLSWYPEDTLKLLGFGAAPKNPFASGGEGGLVGVSMDKHWNKASLQLLYAFESPKPGSDRGIHRAGMSVKADLILGLVTDLLYTYNDEVENKLDGLSFSMGADYSFFDGDLIVLAEYLYNGKTSSTAFNSGENIFGRLNEQYLYTGLTWRFNDFTNAGAAMLFCIDDISFTPILSLNHDLFQGATLTVSAQIPMDRDLFNDDGNRGELGPIPPGGTSGTYFNLNAKLRLRF